MADLRTARSVEHALRILSDRMDNLSRVAPIGPRGAVSAPYQGLAAGSINTTEAVQIESVTFTAEKDRIYEITHIRSEAILTGTPILTNRFRVANAASITTSSTLIRSFNSVPGGAFSTETRVCFWISTFTGTATIGLSSVTNASGTAQVDAARQRDLLVKDVGYISP